MKKMYISFFIVISSIQCLHLEYFEPKTPSHSLSSEFIKNMQNIFHTSIFIESGTFCGETLERALPFFEELYSIELSNDLYQRAVKKFKNFSNVHILEGSSDTVLNELLPTLSQDKRILFWLDGHYSAGNTALGTKETPIIEELVAIKNSGIKNAVLLIDDVRCFFYQEPDFPTVQELKELVLSINPDYQFYIFGDLALAFLPEDNIQVSSLISLITTLNLKTPISQTEAHGLTTLHNYQLLKPFIYIANT